ncbi:Prefoldin subunit 5 [Geodia barretti]|uniref:Prefoldin subunit 5 n=1 Tax=Geodia barretti TaxID=519541 RepID=A0AA35W433_GEOBA|nr:Prefoldin subunit 5 [Geodia barretti]
MASEKTTKSLKLSQLSLQQLDRFKAQLNEEVSILTSSMQSLKTVQLKLKESKESLDSVNDKSEGKPILVPLTSSMYVPGKLKDTSKVLVDVGTGFYIEKNVPGAQDYFQRRIDFITRNIEEVQKNLQEKHMIRENVVSMMQTKLQAQMQAMRVAK